VEAHGRFLNLRDTCGPRPSVPSSLPDGRQDTRQSRASFQVRRPSRPDPKTDGLDAWVHCSEYPCYRNTTGMLSRALKSSPTVRLVVFPLLTMLYKSIVPAIPICSLSSVRSRPGPPWGPVGGLPRARDETGRQNVVRPRLSFLLVGQL